MRYDKEEIKLLLNNPYFVQELQDLINTIKDKQVNIDLSKITINQCIEYVLERCENDFLLFCKIFFPYVSVGGGNLMVHQGTEILCRVMTLIYEKKIPSKKIVLINIMPRSGKTLTCDTLFSAWLFAKGKNIIEKTYTSSQATATEKHKLFNYLVKTSLYRYFIDKYWKNVSLQTNSGTTTFNPISFKTTNTIGTSAIGGDASFVILDDPNNPQVFAGKECEMVVNVFSKSLSTRNLGVKDAYPNVIIQQRVSPNDLSGWLLEYQKDNLIHICLREYEDHDVDIEIPLKDGTTEILHRKAGHLRDDPEFLEHVEQKKKEPYTYQALYQQNPAMAENELLFKPDNFYFYDKNIEGKFKACWITADMSVDGKGDSDFTAIGYWEVIDDKIVLIDLFYDRFDVSVDRLELLRTMYNKHNTHSPYIILEDAQTNKWLQRDLAQVNIPCRIVARSGNASPFAGSKLQRFLTASFTINTHTVCIPVEYKQKILNELNLITAKTVNSVHDDFADILSDSCIMYKTMM